jgi:aminoglycoside 2''-phosphotransferase
MDAETCRRVLRTCLPSPAPRDVRYLAEGWASTVFLIDNGLIIRFPKNRDAAETLEREARLLPELAPRLPVPIPVFRYVVRDCPGYPFPFAGYPLVPGVQLATRPTSTRATPTLARQTGAFLSALHAFPVVRAEALGIPPAHVAGGSGPWRRFAALAAEQLGPLLTATERTTLAAWFARAAGEGLFDFEPVLTHGDLGPDHLLVDPGIGDLTGVIDFGDVGVGDPAIDFTGLLRWCGGPFARAALDAYTGPADARLLDRAACYAALGPVHEIIYGVSIADAEHATRGLAALRAGILRGQG